MPAVDLAALVAEAEAKAPPAVRLAPAESPADELTDAPAASRIGGAPDLAPDLAWPTRDGRPLSFLAQLDCAALRAAGASDWLPETGLLLFFYDLVDQPWGYDPAHRGGWAVLHDPRGPAVAAHPVPDGAEPEDGGCPDPTPLAATPMRSLPGPRRLNGALADDDEEGADRFADLRIEPFRGGPFHQVEGWPNAVQQDHMEWECALASSGLSCGDGEAYRSPEGLALRPRGAEWRLLLQLDSDEERGMVWVDDGRLYFWIREEDARAGRWDAAWMILQCY